ncbi:DnaA N-terminal domain-containing protein [Paracoccus ravus]|uniref:DnaA N-terminal domain-containing protein n=1 Tax=Paracoccus ravus TaxID=2447760 RepID=UPI00106E3FEA|nr:DnaA N-terminal domain-containing protein [Paracoccus ravus]
MDLKRFTGPQAGSQKYDLLTALAVAGLNGTAGFQTSMLRLIALVTARYNWKSDEVTVGQRDLARLWAVDERTVKREVKRLTEMRILLQLRPGVRGRVAAYRLNKPEIHRISADYWEMIGPDFSVRMVQQETKPQHEGEKIVRVDFRHRSGEADPLSRQWQRTLERLAQSDPGLHQNWFGLLAFEAFEDGLLRLGAPSAFVAQYVRTHHQRRLQDIAALEFTNLRRIEVTP